MSLTLMRYVEYREPARVRVLIACFDYTLVSSTPFSCWTCRLLGIAELTFDGVDTRRLAAET